MHAAVAQRFNASSLRAAIMTGDCGRPRGPLSLCAPLANPGAASKTLYDAFHKVREHDGTPSAQIVPGHLHSLRIGPASKHFVPHSAGWVIGAQCYALTVRDPVDRLRSAFNFYFQVTRRHIVEHVAFPGHTRSPPPCGRRNQDVNWTAFFGGVCVRSLGDWLRALRDESDPRHARARISYVHSVQRLPNWLPNRVNVPSAEDQDLFLLPQVDWVRGLDCRAQSLHLLRTESLTADMERLVNAYRLPCDADDAAKAAPVGHKQLTRLQSLESSSLVGHMHNRKSDSANGYLGKCSPLASRNAREDSGHDASNDNRHVDSRRGSTPNVTSSLPTEGTAKVPGSGAQQVGAHAEDLCASDAEYQKRLLTWQAALRKMPALDHAPQSPIVSLSDEERAFVLEKLYPFDAELHRIAAVAQSVADERCSSRNETF